MGTGGCNGTGWDGEGEDQVWGWVIKDAGGCNGVGKDGEKEAQAQEGHKLSGELLLFPPIWDGMDLFE